MLYFTVALRSGLRKSKCALFEWFRPVWLLCKRLVITLAWIFAVAVLPIYAFVEEGPNAGAMWTSAIGFFSALWEAAKVGPSLAIGGAIALFITCWNLFQRYVSKSKIPEVMDLQRDYMDFYEHEFESRIAPLRATALEEDKYNLVIEKVNELLVKLCARLETSFEIMTGGKCCASIKIFNESQGTIRTGARGFYADHKRKPVDEELPSFKYKDNSAFAELIDTGYGGEDFYISNLLPFWWIIGCYGNKNPQWMRFYTATVVLPICIETQPKQVVGFLCVDNLNGRFPKSLSRAVLKSYARAACNLLSVLGQIRKE
jgi:hypothetical protein